MRITGAFKLEYSSGGHLIHYYRTSYPFSLSEYIKSDLLFSLALGHGTAMAEYLARVITGRRDLVIERVLSQKELINEGAFCEA